MMGACIPPCVHALGLLAALAALPAHADDADALLLADQAQFDTPVARDWQLFVETAFVETGGRDGSTSDNLRLSLDLQLDKALAPGWRLVFADRLDLSRRAEPGRLRQVNTVKEAYLSWQPHAEQVFDFGRVNARYGVASGYNPTDYFRDRANRSVISADPASQKRNRQGSVMLRSQTLWEGGSFSLLYSPKLAMQSNPATWNPDLGATNNRHRWLLAASTRFSENIQPQWLLYGEQGQSPQLGFNLATLVNNAMVSYVEWSGGRSASLLAQALGNADDPDDRAFRNRLGTGLTYTAANKISATVEYQYNGAGLDDARWEALPLQSPAAYGQYRRSLSSGQELPTRQALFFYGSWQDVLIPRLDLNAMLRLNPADRSRLVWLEARYHWDRSEVALQWQHNSGGPVSEYGAAPQKRVAQVVVRYFF